VHNVLKIGGIFIAIAPVVVMHGDHLFYSFNVNVALSIMDYISPPIIRPSVSAAAIF
jgi:hypothetical protein